MLNQARKSVLSLFVAATVTGGIGYAEACSRILWETEDYGVFVSRTMDWFTPSNPTVEVRTKGQSYTGYDGEGALEWTSKYASIGMTAFGVGLVDGFNEVGFSANGLFLDEENVGEIDDSKKQIVNTRFIAYLLDSFATVEEALEVVEQLQVHQFGEGAHKLSGHYSLQDASGDSAIIEFVDGEWSIFHGKEYKVMTNSPVYQQHLKNWEEVKPSNATEYQGTFELPGNVISSQRFIWNSYMSEQLKEPTSYTNGLAKLDSVTYKVPNDAANRVVDGEMTGYDTQYTLTYNLDQQILNVRYQYQDTYTHYFVNFEELNDGENYTLQADRADLFGDVTSEFKPSLGTMANYYQ